MNTKTCRMCNKQKLISDFHKDSRRLDGLQSNCKSCKRDYQKNYYVSYNKKNRQKRNNYFNEKIKSDMNFRLAHNLRCRLRAALKRQKASKTSKTLKLLGCSLEKFKQYLESKFQPGMSWDNYGQWHIDHIIPISRLKLTNLKQIKKACHYKNLQPLWAEDNLRKNNKI